MIKKHLFVFVVGILGGIFAFYVMRHSLKPFVSAPSVSTVIPLPMDFWQNIVVNESLSSIAIQSFADSVLLKQSSGMVLSSDGLIVTTADAIVSSGYYQVLVDDKTLKASILAWDYGKNLAIFKVPVQNLNVSDLDDLSSPGSGQELVVTGKFVNISKPIIFSQKALINYVLGSDIVLDTTYNVFLSGAKVIDKNSRMVGMAYVRGGKIHLIKSQTIGEFLKSQLNKKRGKGSLINGG